MCYPALAACGWVGGISPAVLVGQERQFPLPAAGESCVTNSNLSPSKEEKTLFFQYPISLHLAGMKLCSTGLGQILEAAGRG